MGFFKNNKQEVVRDDEQNFQGNKNLEVNKKNSEEFENLMDNASSKLDSYWDKNNPLLQIFLLLLFIIIVLGAIYYLASWNATK